MRSTIFEIGNDLEQLEEMLAEVNFNLEEVPGIEEALEITKENFEQAFKRNVNYLKFNEGEIATVDKEIARLQKIKKARKHIIDRAKFKLKYSFELTEKSVLDFTTFKAKLSPSYAVKINNPDNFCDKYKGTQYIKEKVTYAPDKNLITKVLKEGILEIPGATLETNYNLRLT